MKSNNIPGKYTFFPTEEEKKNFKYIPDFGGRYAISQSGEIWDRIRHLKIIPTRTAESSKDELQHVMINLVRPDGRRSANLAAKLVAATWMPLEDQFTRMHVRYKDGNPKNIHVSNLVWVTPNRDRDTGCKQVYVWVHTKHGQFVGRRKELQKKFDLDAYSVGLVAKGKQKKTKGWRCIACELR